MDYSLRQATTADFDYCYLLHRSTMRGYVEATWGWNEEWQRDYFEKKFDPDSSKIIQIYGQNAGILITENQRDELYLALIEIAPPFQDQGLGSKIIRDLQTQAQDQQKPLTLHVLKANQSARHLYERLGFVQKAEEENKYYMVWQPVPNNTM